MAPPVDDPNLIAAALPVAATALAGNGEYETAKDIAQMALEIADEWERTRKREEMNRPHKTRRPRW
ncbi:MAG: hypothetical protein H7840_03630 [Alphaproteobacteria bacterium]